MKVAERLCGYENRHFIMVLPYTVSWALLKMNEEEKERL